ncbi:MAG: hypothetical protein AAF225_00815 [Pseudomonadota bacterium]
MNSGATNLEDDKFENPRPVKVKQRTNIRAAGKDDAVRLTPPRRLNLEEAISFIGDDDLPKLHTGTSV